MKFNELCEAIGITDKYISPAHQKEIDHQKQAGTIYEVAHEISLKNFISNVAKLKPGQFLKMGSLHNPDGSDIIFDNVERVGGGGKQADLVLKLGGLETCFISLKYHDYDDEKSDIPFWGALQDFEKHEKTGVSGSLLNNLLQELGDGYCDKIDKRFPELYYTIDDKENQLKKVKEVANINIDNPYVGDVAEHLYTTNINIKEKFNSFYLTPHGAFNRLDLVSNGGINYNDPKKIFALKVIFGVDFERGAKFGYDNVNCVISSTNYLTFTNFEAKKAKDITANDIKTRALELFADMNKSPINQDILVKYETLENKNELLSIAKKNLEDEQKGAEKNIEKMKGEVGTVNFILTPENIETTGGKSGGWSIDPHQLTDILKKRKTKPENLKPLIENRSIFVNPSMPQSNDYWPVLTLKYTNERKFSFNSKNRSSPVMLFGTRGQLSPAAYAGSRKGL